MENYRRARAQLIQSLPAQIVGKYARFALPLEPDLMEEPGLHPNPLAWYYRYQRQYFETAVLRVTGAARQLAAPGGSELIPPIKDPGVDEAIERLKKMQKELESQKKSAP
jgi:hypothetical protein